MILDVDETMDAVAFGESVNEILFVLGDAR
jgi:hypothetical protein